MFLWFLDLFIYLKSLFSLTKISCIYIYTHIYLCSFQTIKNWNNINNNNNNNKNVRISINNVIFFKLNALFTCSNSEYFVKISSDRHLFI